MCGCVRSAETTMFHMRALREIGVLVGMEHNLYRFSTPDNNVIRASCDESWGGQFRGDPGVHFHGP
eukprot:2015344-Karenia_brevis.AAC.1